MNAPRGTTPAAAAVLLSLTLALAAGCATGGRPAADEHVILVTDKGFEPKVTEVRRGEPVRLLVTRKSDHTCATEMKFAGLDTSFDLPLGRAVRIELPANLGDTLRYACGMDMYNGMVVAK